MGQGASQTKVGSRYLQKLLLFGDFDDLDWRKTSVVAVSNHLAIRRELYVFNPSILLSSELSVVGAKDLESVGVQNSACTVSITNGN